VQVLSGQAHDANPTRKPHHRKVEFDGRQTSLRLELADRVNRHLFWRDIVLVLRRDIVLVVCHLAQELLELAAAFLAYMAL